MVHIREIVEYVESKVDVHLVKSACVFSQLADLLLFRGCFFGFLQGIIQLLVNLASGRFFEKPVNFFFQLLEVFFLSLYFLLFNQTLV